MKCPFCKRNTIDYKCSVCGNVDIKLILKDIIKLIKGKE